MSESLSSHILREEQIKNGQYITIRKPIEDDAKNMIEYLNIVGGESDNLLFGENEFNLTIDEEKEYIKRLNSDSNTLMILGIIEDKIVSSAQITTINRKRIAHNSELAISVKKEYWRMGIGSIMLEALISFAKKQGTIKNISLGVKASNHNAIKMYEKFGFQKVGVHKDYFNINGVYDDKVLMDLYI